jgi:hypothetical protein
VDSPVTEWSTDSRVTAPAIVTARSSGVRARTGAVIICSADGEVQAETLEVVVDA